MTLIMGVEYFIYAVSAIGIAAATYGLFSVGRAFYREDYLLRNDPSKTNSHPPTHS